MVEQNKRSSLTATINERLRTMILTGELAPGQVVIESDLAERFDSSKTPVREALHQLVTEGLVSVLPKKGYLVRPMTQQDLTEVLDLRMLLEPHAAAECARFADAETIGRLRECLDRQEAAGPKNPMARTERARSFHLEIAHSARSTRLLSSLQRCYAEMVRAHHVLPQLCDHLGNPRELEEHEAIYKAITEGQSAAAAEAMRVHVRTIRSTMGVDLGAEALLWRG